MSTVDSAVTVHTWVAEALAPYQGDRLIERHDRAKAMRQHRLDTGAAGFEDLTEIARHLSAAGRFDELATFANESIDTLSGALAVSAFLGEVLAVFPRDHSDVMLLMDRDLDALISLGNRETATRRAEEVFGLARHRAAEEPDSVRR